jgi:hypothetical protein
MALAGVDAAVLKLAALVLNLVVAAIATGRFARAGHFSWKSSALAACAPPFSTLIVGIGKEY